MKKLIVTFVLVLMPTLFFAQSMFDKFEDEDEIMTVLVNKKMFELMGNVKSDPNNKNSQQFFDLIKRLDNLKVFTTESTKHKAEMKKTVDAYLKKYPLEELMRINEGGRSIKIYVKSGATSSQVKELLMFMDGGDEETVLMSLTGNFDIKEISFLTDYMKIPGGDEIKKASSKKSK
ncbi:DUF4252 domain-containing protein [Flavobacterium beibuense]|uniref:DUF4252 domain containing protein n=1 Tax=Flavobacterium beibuense TaxID=657326 RepID=A0A444W3Z9_9FLAO|nr:DUF4252 domain-containing protein [Flavobacterium beibuense]RYJ40514.1 DUF4252 domain containing protein [Flavobacterium beibuense]